ncbi:MAG: hypothetical protein QOH61_2647 [Chloroflexota bacterium]|nr:hypothetical protein [Chloroflexota bacterium]
MIDALLSLATVALSLLLTLWIGRQWLRRRRPHQLAWSVAFTLFTIGVASQLGAALIGWSEPLYRIWYLSGAVLAAAWLGHGTVLLLAGTRMARVLTLLLAVASVVATGIVLAAPVDFALGTAGGPASGAGFPGLVRMLTPIFNVYGTGALLIGAAVSLSKYLWSGGNGRRSAGTAMIGVGTLVIALGGTLSRFGVPEALYLSELVALLMILAGFSLTASPGGPGPVLSSGAVARRRRLVTRVGVGVGATALLGSIAILPALPWVMGIVTDARHVYAAEVPQDNRGAYLVTDQGVMQLFTWYVQPDEFPRDAPTLPQGSVREIAVVQKLFDDQSRYQLIDLTTNRLIALASGSKVGMRWTMRPDADLAAAEYLLVVPLDGMFGGQTWHYFRVG